MSLFWPLFSYLIWPRSSRPLHEHQLRGTLNLYSRKMFGFNITPEAIVGPISMLGARWAVKNIKFTKFYT